VSREEAEKFATKADIADLKAEISNSKLDMQRFIFTALVTQFVFIVGMVITLIQILT